MTFDADPYAVLGLPRGASDADVKRAYRRLAKAFHPDAAGPSAMTRFLAIQAAYEQLTGGPGGPGGVPGAAPGRGSRRPSTPSWQAEADRARASRDPWGSRGRRSAGGTGATSAGSSAGPGGPGTTGTGSERRSGGGSSAGSGGRGRRRATPGSTSYDEAAQDPFDPEWSGASWYGQSSGTYWTLNPREYADPRKHGPEYQARARRTVGDGDEATAEQEGAAPGGDAQREPRPREEPVGDASGAGLPPRPRRAREATWEAGRRPGDAPPRPEATTAGAGAAATWRQASGDRPRVAAAQPASSSGDLPSVGLPPLFHGPGARLALALVGWPPLGLGLAWLAGELSGCGRFSASCGAGVEAFGLGTWLVQLVVIALLLVIPGAAAISAVGTVGMLAAAVPAAVVLSTAGGAYAPGPAASALGIFLAVGYVGGVAFAIVRRSRTIPA